MEYRRSFFIIILLLVSSVAHGQRFDEPLISIKTNILSASAGSINAAAEFVLRHQRSLDDSMTSINLPVSYNPFTFGNNKKIKHIAFQPEFRVRKPISFGSVFLGANALYAFYNVGGVNIPFNLAHTLSEKRYQGQLFGAGLSGGYYLKLAKYFGLEGVMSAGYAYMDHIIYKCPTCGTKVGEEKKSYFGLTKAALSIAYTLK